MPDQPTPATQHPGDASIRPALPADAKRLGVLATQVFLDTYATDGISQPVADEVCQAFSTGRLAQLLAQPGTRILVAERGSHLLGFAQSTLGTPLPAVATVAAALWPGIPCELDRLYVQEPFTGRGLGARLLLAAQADMAARGAALMWLTPWVGNHRALHFYARQGYQDFGRVDFHMGDVTVDNRVLALGLAAGRDGQRPADRA